MKLVHNRSRYVNYGCRCEVCTEASAEYQRQRRKRLANVEPPRHGVSGYNDYSCRCPICSAAASAAKYGHKEKA